MPGRFDSILSKILTATIWQWLVLLVVVIVLVRLVVWVKASLYEDDDPSTVDHQMLAEITEMQRQGEITGTEYRSIKGRLVDRLKENEKPSSKESEAE